MRMTPKRAERTEHDYRYSTCRTAIGIYSRNEVRRPSYSQAMNCHCYHTVLLEGEGRLPRDYSISQNVSNEGKYNGHVKTRHTRWTPRKPGGWCVCKMKKTQIENLNLICIILKWNALSAALFVWHFFLLEWLE